VTTPLPVGTRLLHIGPQKTGTTSLQGALHNSRVELEALGVHYAGQVRQQRVAAAAVIKKAPLPGNDESSLGLWPALVTEVAKSRADRVVISAEMFSNAGPAEVREIVAAFGPNTHVVITLRPLVKLMPSQWQQYVQSWMYTGYESWLDQMFNHADTSKVSPSFWVRHRHDELTRRWAEVVGPENVTVIALDEGRRGMNLRCFEELLALPAGTLVADERSNRSLTLPEIELAREINRQFRGRGWPKGVYEKVVRFGMFDYLKARTPAPGEPQLTTPAWAVERADQVAAEMIEGIAASGVNVMGDLQSLRLSVTAPEHVPTVESVDLELAARAAIGMIEWGVMEPRRSVVLRHSKTVLRNTPTRELVKVAATRTKDKILPPKKGKRKNKKKK
jgi:hypothetical protein